jgi:hypothetical protein
MFLLKKVPRATFISHICKTTDANRLKIFVMICRFNFTLSKKWIANVWSSSDDIFVKKSTYFGGSTNPIAPMVHVYHHGHGHGHVKLYVRTQVYVEVIRFSR